MATTEELKFAHQAMYMGLITPHQLQDCLRLQERCGSMTNKPKPLVECLLRQGLLEHAEVQAVFAALAEDSNEQMEIAETEEPTREYRFPMKKILTEGQSIDKYEIIRQIGEGGMGQVYLARDRKVVDRIVAIKAVFPENDRQAMRFRREAEIAASLDHPNIVKIYDIVYERNAPFMAMQYIEGHSLGEYLSKQNLPLQKRVTLILDVVKALAYAHKKDVLHRDIKPMNIIVDKYGKPHLMDFGLAKMIQVADKSLTRSGFVMGTPAYMSPEQAQGESRRLDARSDIYSLGAVLYEVLTGQRLVEQKNLMSVLFQVLEGKPRDPSELNPEISPELRAICLKAIAKPREDRYQTMTQLANDLQAFLRGKPVRAMSSANYRSLLRRGWRIAPYLSGLVLCAIVFLLLRYENQLEDSPVMTLDDLKKVAERDPTPEKLTQYAVELMAGGRYKIAKEQIIKAMKSVQPENGALMEEIQKLHIQILVELAEYTSAEEKYQQLHKSPRDVRVEMAMVKTYYYQKRWNECQNIATKIVDTFPNTSQEAEALYYLGLLAYDRGDYQSAAERFINVLNVSSPFSKRAMARFYCGVCYFHQKQFVKARQNLQIVQQLLPGKIEVDEYLGEIYFAEGNLQKAEEYFAKCTKNRPEEARSWQLLAKLLFRQKKYIEAEEMYGRALQIAPHSFVSLEGMMKSTYHNNKNLRRLRTLMLEYISALQTDAPDIHTPTFREIQNRYADSFNLWQALAKKKGKPEIFFKKIFVGNPTAYEIAEQGLVSLRYSSDIEQVFDDFLHREDISISVRSRIRRIRQRMEGLRYKERQEVLYYLIAKNYLERKKTQLAVELVAPQELVKVLRNRREDVRIRYLAAQSLLHLHEFEVIEEGSNSQDLVERAICLCILREANLPHKVKPSVEMMQQVKPFLLALIAYHLRPEDGIEMSLLLQHSDDIVRISAATNYLQWPQISLRENAQKIIIESLRDRRPYVRAYAHYHLWQWVSQRKKAQEVGIYQGQAKSPEKMEQYSDYLQGGLDDPSEEVQRTVLQFVPYLYIPQKCIESLVRHTHIAAPPEKQFLAILGLISSKNIQLKRIIADPERNSIIRSWAMVMTILFHVRENISESGTTFELAGVGERLRQIHRELQHYAQDQDPYFRGTVYWLAALLGYKPQEFLQHEKVGHLRATLMAALGSNPISPLISFLQIDKGMTSEQCREIIRENLHNPNPLIRRNAYASYIFLGNQRWQTAKSLKKSNDEIAREGVAFFIYEYVFADVMRNGGISDQFLRPLLNIETKYRELLQTTAVENIKKREEYLRYLSLAIELKDTARYRFDRAILLRAAGKLTEARRDLQVAVDLGGDCSFFFIELAHLSWQLDKDQSVARNYLAKALLSTDKRKLYLARKKLRHLNNFSEARKMLRWLYLRHPEDQDLLEWSTSSR